MARTHRAEIVAAAERADALAQRPAIVSALEDPVLAPSVDHYPFTMMEEDGGDRRYDWSLTVEQRLPLSDVRSQRRRSAQAEADRARADADRTALDVLSDAQRAFFMLRERRQMRGVLEQQRELVHQLVTSAAARYASGTGSQADVLRAEVESARVNAQQRSLVAQIRGAEAMLNAAMGLPVSAPVGELEYSPSRSILLSGEALQKSALARRPELRAGEAEIERALAEIGVMRSMYRPMAMIRVGRASTMAEGEGAMVMVGVSVPMWLGRLRAGVAEARAMERMARADLTAMQLMVQGEAAAAREEVLAAEETLSALETEVIPRASMAADAALAAYSSGQSTLVSVVEAFNALWRARGDLVMAEAALGQATVRFQRAVGADGGWEDSS